jgi:hypothetical protein
MRYASGTFTFTKIRTNATDEGVNQVATAFASLQSEPPRQVLTVVTQQLY